MTDSLPGEPPAANPAPPSAAAPPPPPPPATPPLTRSLTDRRVAGVCGGLAAHLQVSAWLLRAGFIAVTFVGGLGILLYVGAWILLPEQGSSQRFGWNSLAVTERHNTRLFVALLVLALAVVVFAGGFHATHDGILLGVVLLGVGAFLLLQERREWNHSATTAPMPAAHTPYAAGTFTTAATRTEAPPSAWGRPARPRSILGVVTVAAALLAVGIAALLNSAGVVTVSVAACAAIALIVVGSGLIAGAWFGRSRGLIVLGTLLIPFTATMALVDQPLSGGVGNVIAAPQGLAELHSDYHLAAGQLTVDLSQIPLRASPTVNVTVALGKLTVVLAPQANFYIAAHAGGGRIDILGARDDGFNIDSPVGQSPSPGGGTIRLALSVGFGEIQVVDSTVTPAQGQ